MMPIRQRRVQQAPQRWWWRWTVCLASWLLRGLYATLRPTFVQRHCERRAWQTGKPVLLAFWHGRLLYFLHLYQHQRVTVLVSQSRDGEWISQLLAKFGVHTTRGSSSRGSVRSLLAIVKKVRSGSHAAVTPDGPRGPRYQLQPGIVAVAKQTGAAILPMTYAASWQKVLRSWDAFVLPLPFSRVVVIYGEPIYVPADASTALFQAKIEEVETSLRCITTMADNYFHSAAHRHQASLTRR